MGEVEAGEKGVDADQIGRLELQHLYSSLSRLAADERLPSALSIAIKTALACLEERDAEQEISIHEPY